MSRERTVELKGKTLPGRSRRPGGFIRTGIGCLVLILGCLFLMYGIHRREHLTVEQKSNMICLECIGIG